MSAKSDPTKRRLAFGIIDFLQDAMNDGTVTADDKDSIEVAVQCISDVFGIDATDETQRSTIGMGNQKLMQLFSVYEKTREKMLQGSQSSPSTSAPTGPSDEDKAKAEDLKSQGNAAMSRRDYPTAIALYTEALTLTPSNPIYLSNRAAAYSQSGQQDLAAADAQTAVDIDPKYGKGWSRLGHAKFAAGDAKGAMEAYRRGVEVDPSSEVMKKGYETAKKRVEEDEAEAEASSSPAERSTPAAGSAPGAGGMPDLSSLMGALGGGGSGGGMPDLASMMQNPMIAQMAQNMMQSGALDSLLSNPRMAQMASQFQNGQMPNIGDLMNDPEMRDMARNFMGGGAGGAPGAGAGAGGR
ncbi:Small glutamine-rich tetratricopeptide repeat-containing protein 2 [Saitoella coloradoensis]